MTFVRYRGEIVHRKTDKYGDRGEYKGLITIDLLGSQEIEDRNIKTVETLFDTNKRRLAARINRRGKELLAADLECAGIENVYVPIRL